MQCYDKVIVIVAGSKILKGQLLGNRLELQVLFSNRGLKFRNCAQQASCDVPKKQQQYQLWLQAIAYGINFA